MSFVPRFSLRLPTPWLRLGSLLILITSMGLGLGLGNQHAAADPATPTVFWPSPQLAFRVGGLSSPSGIVSPPDGTKRIFITERTGFIRIFQNGALLAQPFLDLTSYMGCTFGETGVLGLAFPADYAQKGFFYVYHTKSDCNIALARYRVSANPNVADYMTREELLTVYKSTTFHNGGQILFHPVDGYLYIGVGDDEFNGGPNYWAQDPSRLVGKILRIGVQSQAGTWYSIPPTNPYTQTGGSPLVWAMGVRNPFRFSFDRLTHDFWLGDVGDLVAEEANYRPASVVNGHGGNYGWPSWEADICRANCGVPHLAMPILAYPHHDGCTAGIGGYVYRGTKFPRLYGTYFFSEFCWGTVGAVKRDSNNNWQWRWVLDAPFSISTMGEDEAGNIYVADFNNGGLYELVELTTYIPYVSR